MIKNLKEIILNKIASLLVSDDFETCYANGKRPALEELEILNKLLMNVTESDLVNIPNVKDEYDTAQCSSGCIETSISSTPCIHCYNYSEYERIGKSVNV